MRIANCTVFQSVITVFLYINNYVKVNEIYVHEC